MNQAWLSLHGGSLDILLTVPSHQTYIYFEIQNLYSIQILNDKFGVTSEMVSSLRIKF